ncbi:MULTISPECIES: cold shock domain-containing protein [Advenella]|uniref:Putative cold-shock DNA-binding protein n=1 Tax=Advenella incenata TaxID=267800 RepID=A0A4Q7V788_9BURK|nr:MULTISPECIES: cold shock domain-containing protein [Advenella]RZT91724.1 putative cold-shock DNA-binding protein [Advenella incenata]
MKLSEETVGTIKCYFPLKGYGFITRQAGKDLFFHFRDVRGEEWALEGVKVGFRVQRSEKGLQAVDIYRIS